MYNNNKYKNNMLQLTNTFNKKVYDCARGNGQSCLDARNLYVEIDLLYNNAFPYMLNQAQKYARKQKLKVVNTNGLAVANKKRVVPRVKIPPIRPFTKRVSWKNGKIVRGIIIQPIRNQPVQSHSYQNIHNAVSRFSFSGDNMDTNRITRFI